MSEMKFEIPQCISFLLWVAVCLVLSFPDISYSQTNSELARSHLESNELLQRREAIVQKLMTDLPASTSLKRNGEEFIEAYSFILTLHGITAPTIDRLHMEGIDILNAAMSGPRSTVLERAAMSEAVIIGKVERYFPAIEPDDGYRSSIVVNVEEILTGDISNEEIIIRQRSGKTADGQHIVEISTDVNPKAGERYLFYLSNSLYRYRTSHPEASGLQKPDGDLSNSVLSTHYITYGKPHKFDNGVLQPAPHVGSPSQEETNRLLNQIRDLGRLMR
jgi:hypothetical protein